MALQTKRRVPYRLDGNGNVIAAAVRVMDVLATSISSSAWTAITLPTGTNSKAILCQLRNSNSAWQITTFDELSASATTGNYATLKGTVTMDIAGEAGETLFYVRSSAGAAAKFEVVVLD